MSLERSSSTVAQPAQGIACSSIAPCRSIAGRARALPAWLLLSLVACAAAGLAAQDTGAAAAGGTSSAQAIHPAAKSQQERDDFNRAYALSGAAPAEAAANDFSTRYPG